MSAIENEQVSAGFEPAHRPPPCLNRIGSPFVLKDLVALLRLSVFIVFVLPLKTSGTDAKPSADPINLESFDAAWRIIRDSYFDPTFGGLDWDAIRVELRAKAEAASTITETRSVIQEMVDRLGASHMTVIPRSVAASLESLSKSGTGTSSTNPNGRDASGSPTHTGNNLADPPKAQSRSSGSREGDLGFEVRLSHGNMMVTRVDPGSPADDAGVQSGWILDRLENEEIETLLQSISSDMRGSHGEFLAWNLVTGKLQGAPGSTALLRLLDSRSKPVVLALERRKSPGEPSTLGFLPTLYSRFDSERLALPGGGTVGYMRFNLWLIPIVRALDEKVDEFRQADGMIIDLRGNLGGLGGMILGVSGHFLNERISLGTLKMRGNELNFFANPRRVNAKGVSVLPYSGPLAILIDRLSLSAAEIFAGGMQAVGRAHIFGEKSGGQALPAVWDRLPNGDVLYHAFGDFVTPKGDRLEGRGVQPDETVMLQRQDLLQGRDQPVLSALQWIAEEKAKSKNRVQ